MRVQATEGAALARLPRGQGEGPTSVKPNASAEPAGDPCEYFRHLQRDERRDIFASRSSRFISGECNAHQS